jgi:hypothetical protein
LRFNFDTGAINLVSLGDAITNARLHDDHSRIIRLRLHLLPQVPEIDAQIIAYPQCALVPIRPSNAAGLVDLSVTPASDPG